MVPRRKSTDRGAVTLACSICKNRNYQTTKRREQRLEMKKYCRQCNEHTTHIETK